MQLSEKRQELITKLEGVFPNDTVRTFSAESQGIPVTTTVTVNKIGKKELCELTSLVNDMDVDVELKRSGTDITIKII